MNASIITHKNPTVSFYNYNEQGKALSGLSTHYHLAAPNSDIDRGQNWLKQWSVAWRHLAIALINAD